MSACSHTGADCGCDTALMTTTTHQWELSILEQMVSSALRHAQKATVADSANEAITHTRNALSDAYRHVRAANEWVQDHQPIDAPTGGP